MLEKRTDAILTAHMDVMERYMSELAEGDHWDTLEANKHWLHNHVVEHLCRDGMGIPEVEKAVQDVRLEIQRYFKRFNPVA